MKINNKKSKKFVVKTLLIFHFFEINEEKNTRILFQWDFENLFWKEDQFCRII